MKYLSISHNLVFVTGLEKICFSLLLGGFCTSDSLRSKEDVLRSKGYLATVESKYTSKPVLLMDQLAKLVLFLNSLKCFISSFLKDCSTKPNKIILAGEKKPQTGSVLGLSTLSIFPILGVHELNSFPLSLNS